jgi:hypothetical protein
MTSANPGHGRRACPVDRDIVEQVLGDYAALRRCDTDPELHAVRAAILIEDVFGVTLPDAYIDPAMLADAPAIAALVARLRGAV